MTDKIEKKGPITVAGPPAAGGDKPAAEKPPSRFVQFKHVLDKGMNQMRIALPRHIDPIRFYRVILTAVQTPVKNGQMGILDCTMDSIFSCMLTCAQLGLEPQGPQGHAYLIPFRDNDAQRVVCTLVIGFKGLIKLARNSGEISGVAARVVHEKDQFEYEFGLNDRLWHIPTDEEDPGPVTHAYAVWKFKDGGYHFDVMTRKELDRIKNRKGGPSGFSPWKTDEEEMQKKTVLRKSSKMVPNSIELAHGIAVNDRQDEGLPPMLMETPAADPIDVPSETKEPKALAEKKETLDDIASKAKAKREAKERETVPAARKVDDAVVERAFGKAAPAATPTVPHDADTGEVKEPEKAKAPAKSTRQQQQDLAYLSAEKGVQLGEIVQKYGAPSTTALTFEQAEEAKAYLAGLPDAGEPGSQG